MLLIGVIPESRHQNLLHGALRTPGGETLHVQPQAGFPQLPAITNSLGQRATSWSDSLSSLQDAAYLAKAQEATHPSGKGVRSKGSPVWDCSESNPDSAIYVGDWADRCVCN